MAQNSELIPKHVGLILDGNRRWAKGKGLKTLEGHAKGADVFREVSMLLIDRGVEYVSAYVFSTENWKRTEEEVSYLMRLLLKAIEKHLSEYHEKGIKVLFLGTREGLSKEVVKSIERTEDKTANNTKGSVAVCFNYGGRNEIVDAAKAVVESGGEITEASISDNLYKPEVPDIDLLIRTSGEQRLSGFMLWRASYAELLFMKKLWPDVTIQDIDSVLTQYAERERRFGT